MSAKKRSKEHGVDTMVSYGVSDNEHGTDKLVSYND